MVSWTVAYLDMALMLVVGICVGFRIGVWRYRFQRLRLIQRWRFERRKHRQRNPWVKEWYCHRLLAVQIYQATREFTPKRPFKAFMHITAHDNGKIDVKYPQ